jgi:hypothetical protein
MRQCKLEVPDEVYARWKVQPALRCLTLAQFATRAIEAYVAVPEPVRRAADETPKRPADRGIPSGSLLESP